MTKMEKAIEALTALPPWRHEEVAEIILELTDALEGAPGQSLLTSEQIAEVRRRRDNFVEGDPSRIDALLAQLKSRL